MTLTPAVAAPGTDQPTATPAKIKTASHTKFLTVPSSFQHLNFTRLSPPALRVPFTPELQAPFTPELQAPFTPELQAPFTPELQAPFTPELQAPFTPELQALLIP
jgi:hypothetical protein